MKLKGKYLHLLGIACFWFGCDPENSEGSDIIVHYLDAGEACSQNEIEEHESIEVDKSGFVANGHIVIPNGINSYPLLEHIGNGELEKVTEVFALAKELGRPIVRTNGFMDVGNNPARIRDDDGRVREAGLEALDQLLVEAKQAGVRLLLVLANNWDDYGGAGAVVDAVAKGEHLPKDAFWSEPRMIAAQEQYLEAIITRTNSISGDLYKNDTTIFSFELVNEARCTTSDWCDEATLANWADKMVDVFHNQGVPGPIAWGGAGHLKQHGEDMVLFASRGTVDILTLHLYLNHTHPGLLEMNDEDRIESAVEIGTQIIKNRAALARDYNMPLLLEEFGWKPPDRADIEKDYERSRVYSGWLAAAREEGLATFPWMIGESGRPDYDGLLIVPEDTLTLKMISCK